MIFGSSSVRPCSAIRFLIAYDISASFAVARMNRIGRFIPSQCLASSAVLGEPASQRNSRLGFSFLSQLIFSSIHGLTRLGVSTLPAVCSCSNSKSCLPVGVRRRLLSVIRALVSCHKTLFPCCGSGGSTNISSSSSSFDLPEPVGPVTSSTRSPFFGLCCICIILLLFLAQIFSSDVRKEQPRAMIAYRAFLSKFFCVKIHKDFNRHICIVVPLSTVEKKNPYQFSIGIIADKEAFVITSQIRLIDTNLLNFFLSYVSTRETARRYYRYNTKSYFQVNRKYNKNFIIILTFLRCFFINDMYHC